MSRRPNISDLKKNFYKRSLFWIALVIFGLLTDEYIKEGYLFDIRDVAVYGTHEFLVAILSLLGVVIAMYNKVKDKKLL